MVPGIDPKVDYAFKRLFGQEKNKDLLIHLVNAVLALPPEREITEIEILNPFIEREVIFDKLSILDVKARDGTGRQFNIEMQMVAGPFIRQRLLFYWARLYPQQLHSGEFYSSLNPTITICFLDGVLFADLDDWHLVFELRERRLGIPFLDHLAIHLCELPKFHRTREELHNPLEQWLYFLNHAESFDADALAAPFNQSIFDHAMQELRTLTQDDRERELYEVRLKARMDANSREEADRKTQEESRKAHERADAAEAKAAAAQAEAEACKTRGITLGMIRLLERQLGHPETLDHEFLALSEAELQERLTQLEAESRNERRGGS